MKTFLKVIGGIILFFVALFIGLSLYFNSSRLKKMVVPRLQATVGRPVNIDHMSLSFFKAFPNPAVKIDRMSIAGKTKADTLLSLKQLAIGVKLFPLLSHHIDITELDLDEPRFTYVIYPDSSTNIDFLFDESEADTTSSGYDIAISHFHINNGYFGYIDSTSHTKASVNQLNGSLSLSYADSISSQIDITIGGLSASQGGERYFNGLPVSLKEKSTLYSDQELMRLNNGYLSIHGLKMNLTGNLKNWSKTPTVNLHFKSSSDNFGELLQLMPESYDSYTNDLQTKGSLKLDGIINGKISEKAFPSFNIKMAVRNGYIKDPGLSQPIKNILFTARATNKLLTVDTLHALAGKNKLSGSGSLEDPLKDDGAFRADFLADMDLSTVHQFYDLSEMDVDKLNGKLHGDASLKGNLNKLKNMLFSGKIVLSDGLIKYKDLPKALSPINMDINGSQKLMHIHHFEVHAGQNKITAQGTIRNLADEAHRRVDMNVSMNANLATLKNYYPMNSDSVQLKGTLAANAKLNGKAAEIEHSVQSGSFKLLNGSVKGEAFSLPITDLNAKLKLSPSIATLSTMKANIGSSDINVHGSLTHYLVFLFGDKDTKEVPTLEGSFSSNHLNLDELMPQENDTTSFYPQLPELNTHLKANVKRLEIAGVTMKNLNVQAETTPKQVHLSKANVQLFNGKASGTMRWEIPKQGPSTFHFKGSLDSLQLASFFEQYHILGDDSQFYNYITGHFSAKADYTTKMDTSLNPIIETSTLEGSFGMDQAHVKGHPIQKKLVQFTHLNALKDLTLDSWKSHLSIEDKVLTIKDLSITSNNIGMELNGTEQLVNGNTDFHVSLHLPPKLKNKLGSVLNGQVSKLLTRSNGSLALPLKITGQYNQMTIKPDKSLIQSRLKKEGKHKAKKTIKNIFNRLKHKKSKQDTTKPDSY
jgi:uncharacterized protein involved in outer membrane biogenesis